MPAADTSQAIEHLAREIGFQKQTNSLAKIGFGVPEVSERLTNAFNAAWDSDFPPWDAFREECRALARLDAPVSGERVSSQDLVTVQHIMPI